MWRWTLNWGEIRPDIVIGSCPMTEEDLEWIQSFAGATAVLSLQHADCLAFWDIDEAALRRAGERLGLEMTRFPIRDFDIEDMRRRLPDAIPLLAGMLRREHRVYVHCTAGMGRAPLVVLGYLALVEEVPPEAAFRIIHAGRPEAVPSWEAFEGAREDLAARYKDVIEARAYTLYEKGVNNDARADWIQARSEVLRSVLTPPGSF
jgi:atypical dual specificity phosphatase